MANVAHTPTRTDRRSRSLRAARWGMSVAPSVVEAGFG
jgi:hypothetical protein